MKIFVGNLAYSVTQQNLIDAFAQYGKVTDVNIVMDRYSGQSKGFGFIEMSNNSEADTAMKALNGKPFMGKLIKVNQAQNKPSDRPKRGRSFR